MNILMAIHEISHGHGAACYVRDVSRYMTKQGHKVAIYCPNPARGYLSDEIESFGCLVSDRLDYFDSFNSTIIYGHLHFELMPLLLRYQDIPAIYFNHGVIPFEARPPANLDRIRKHICVSKLTKDELLRHRDLPEDRVTILPNFVDDTVFRFCPNNTNGIVDSRPKALAFGNYKPMEIQEIREACLDLGVPLEEVGGWSKSGNKQSPQNFLPNYDVIFCYGRSAMEALYSGCDVILTHNTGTGELVTDFNFEELRSRNFGYTCCQLLEGKNGIYAKLNKIIDAKRQNKQLLSKLNRITLASRETLENPGHLRENGPVNEG